MFVWLLVTETKLDFVSIIPIDKNIIIIIKYLFKNCHMYFFLNKNIIFIIKMFHVMLIKRKFNNNIYII